MRKVLILAALAALVIASVASAQIALPLPAPPAVTTGAATNVGSGSALVHGTVNPVGEETLYAFQWGPSPGYGNETPLPPASAGSGTAAMSVSAKLSGLAPGTTYHFRIIALSLGGVSTGTDGTFTTTGTKPPPAAPSQVMTGSATEVSASGATLSGTVNPEGTATTYHFEYGTTADYGFETAPADAGAGHDPVTVSFRLGGLASGTTYHFRLVAVNAGGTVIGADHSFTTGVAPLLRSRIRVLGRTGFVSPSGAVGIAVGCFGETSCAGHISLSHAGARIGGRGFRLAPESGGVENVRLSAKARSLLRRQGRLAVRLVVTGTNRQRVSRTLLLIPWG